MNPSSWDMLALSGLFRILERLERHRSRSPALRYPPTFQVGPPRGATTLVRQLIGHSIPTSYLSNLTRLSWYHAGRPLPVTTARLAATLDRFVPQITYQSDYGKVPALAGIAECEVVWDHWFGTRQGPSKPGMLSRERQQTIHDAVAATEHAFGRPFVNKTSVLSLRIRALCEIFPSALFIRTRRDPVDTAQSILIARRGPFPRWIGARPAQGSEPSTDDLVMQACRQVVQIEQSIDLEQQAVGDDRFVEVEYHDVCTNPRQELERIAAFLSRHGVAAPILREPPPSFPYAHGRTINHSTYEALRAGVAELEGRAPC
ncbi:MAG: hypothetical protein DRI90_26505 [Deltaproteobacteria bacterium]|nr:MAG: hypothetical protein DRI90_26505 [Deltaproteobacteria bacterium]